MNMDQSHPLFEALTFCNRLKRVSERTLKWKIHQDRDDDDPELNSYSITLRKKNGGWNTDSGYDGYGLPKELAQWICKMLNKCDEKCPYYMNEFGEWEKNER